MTRPHARARAGRKAFASVGLLLVLVPLSGCLDQQDAGHSPAHPTESAPAAGEQNEIDRSIRGLYPAREGRVVELANGSRYALDAQYVTHDPGTGRAIRMMAYNGELPGPTLRVPQHARVTIDFTNRLDQETTVHWHGLRLRNDMDGVPHATQPPVPPGGSFRYELTFPDAGLFWYHPHQREDLQQELGLYGAILVAPPEAEATPREVVLLLDDILLNGDDVARFDRETPNGVLMGRYGTRELANMRADWVGTTAPGERVRLQLVNTANARPLRLQFEGVEEAVLVALDAGLLRAPTRVDGLVLAPAERATLDILMPADGDVRIVNDDGERKRLHATLRVDTARAPAAPVPTPVRPHEEARAELEEALAAAPPAPTATWTLKLARMEMPMGEHAGMGGGMEGMSSGEPIEWNDPSPLDGLEMTTAHAAWTLASAQDTNATLGTFAFGSLARIRLANPSDAMHPMQHPIHLHGQRFLVLETDGAPNPQPAWKDTVLVPAGSTVDILVEMSNPGTWMAHCHISEHLEAGMHNTFVVR